MDFHGYRVSVFVENHVVFGCSAEEGTYDDDACIISRARGVRSAKEPCAHLSGRTIFARILYFDKMVGQTRSARAAKFKVNTETPRTFKLSIGKLNARARIYIYV